MRGRHHSHRSWPQLLLSPAGTEIPFRLSCVLVLRGKPPPLRRRVPRWGLAPPHAALRQPLLTTRRSSQLQSLTGLPRSNGCCWRSLPTMLCAKDERHSGRKRCGRGGEPNEAWQEARRRNQRRAGHTPPPSCWRTEGQLPGPSCGARPSYPSGEQCGGAPNARFELASRMPKREGDLVFNAC